MIGDTLFPSWPSSNQLHTWLWKMGITFWTVLGLLRILLFCANHEFRQRSKFWKENQHQRQNYTIYQLQCLGRIDYSVPVRTSLGKPSFVYDLQHFSFLVHLFRYCFWFFQHVFTVYFCSLKSYVWVYWSVSLPIHSIFNYISAVFSHILLSSGYLSYVKEQAIVLKQVILKSFYMTFPFAFY